MLQANPTLTFRYLCDVKTFLRLIFGLSLEDEEPLAGADPESFGVGGGGGRGSVILH